MPVVSKETLAMRFRQNWLAKHPVDTQPQNGSTLDDSLTSLNWLHNLNIMKIATPTPPTSPQPADFAPFMGNSNAGSISGYTGSMQVNPNAILNMTGGQSANRSGNFQSSSEVIGNHVVSPASCRLPGSLLDVAPPSAMDKIDYKNNPHVKPPYSYATLICMAMKESKKNKITLAGIYNWITENFMYYRVADPSWQNSIRHNLSLNKCFQKVPRKKDEPGKGGFWRINPEYQDMFVNGVFKKRRGSPPSTPLTAPPIKRLRREEDISVSHILPNASVLLTPGEDYSSLCDIQIKSEPNYDDNTHHRMHASAETALNGDALDFSWGAILNQDIEVGGVKVKTEDIIDEKDPSSPITELSPPPSDHNSDIALEDLLNGDFNTDYQENSNEPVDLSNGGSGVPLDLSIQGVSLKPPEWWTESFNQQMMEAAGMGVPQMSSNTSGLHTPISSSPIHESEISHPWAEEKSDLDQAMASFDAEISSLFHLESVPSVASET